ncbi:hypothetical protein SISNIDRAFT_419999, partial [Sistotremastrum niveocremeum HHB9708]
WRITCSFHLVVTLVRLWGAEPKNSRYAKMLHNVMDLVTATKLGSARELTEERITAFETHMHRYLQEMLDLFPHVSVTLSQHNCLHLPSMFRDFGPAHGFSAWHYERWNHILQIIKTNGRLSTSSQSSKDSIHSRARKVHLN